jgi:hypothetical protein
MAIKLEVKSMISPDLDYGKVHWEPDNCSVLVEVEIGEKGKEGADIFYFNVVTPKFLLEHPTNRWGRGYLILKEFSWREIESFLNKLIHFVKKDTWDEVAVELSKELHWEFDNYQP